VGKTIATPFLPTSLPKKNPNPKDLRLEKVRTIEGKADRPDTI